MERTLTLSLVLVLLFMTFGPLPASFIPRAVLSAPLYWTGVITMDQADKFIFMWER